MERGSMQAACRKAKYATAVVLAAMMLAALSGCGKKADVNEIVSTVEATTDELAAMRASAAKLNGKDPAFTEMPMSTGPFLVKFKSGTHKVIWTVEGEQTRPGPIGAVIAATLGDESGGRVLTCRPPGKEVAAGPARFDCESSPFRVETDKTFILKSGLNKLDGFVPTRMGAEVAAVPVSVGWGGWFSAMIYAMVGAVMLGVWMVFFKR